MRLLVCGGRNYADRDFLNRFLDAVKFIHGPITVLINGGARGADALAARWAAGQHINVKMYDAHWAELGRRAGVIRNIEMLREGKPDIVVCFPGGKGTAYMREIAMRANVFVVDHEI